MAGKVVFVLLVAVSVSYAGITIERIKEIGEVLEKCSKENNSDKGKLITALISKEEITDQGLKCTIDCYLKEEKVLQNNEFDWSKVDEKINKHFDNEEEKTKIMAIAEKCKGVDIKSAGECEVGVTLMKCVKENMGDLNLDSETFKALPF